jgi:hypothetical protein
LSAGPLAVNALAAAPTYTTAPVISGSAWVGQTLTLTQPANWSGAPTITDQWSDCNGSGQSCVAITGQTGSTYVVSGGDLGFTIEVAERATTTDGTGDTNTAFSNHTVTVTQDQPPTNSSLPTISGTARVASTLTVTPGTWNPRTSISDEWYRCTSANACTDTGISASTYPVTNTDLGDTIEAQETAVNNTTSGPAVTSAPTSTVTNPPPTNSTLPTITGNDQQGQNLTEHNGTWSPTATGFTYQWEECNSSGGACTQIDGATNSTYTLTLGDAGHTLDVRETATYANSAPSSPATSGHTGLVLPLPPANSAAPTISGYPEQGQTLTAASGQWTNNPNPSSYTYQWTVCSNPDSSCAAIPGANQQTYTVTAPDVGDTVLVAVTASNAGGTGTTAISDRSGTIQTGSSVQLLTTPDGPLVNQAVTMIATVTSQAAAALPDGSITFTNADVPIFGCVGEPVSPTGQSVTVLCQTSFAATDAQLSAVFTPASGSIVLGSSSPTASVVVGQDASAVVVDLSRQVKVLAQTTYTASVLPPASRSGPIEPSGTVEFLDGGKPIPGCPDQSLSNGTASCSVVYAAPGTHSITARYGGDANFSAHTSTAQTVNVSAAPVKGIITATMQWTFDYAPAYTRVATMVVNGAPAGATVRLQCNGRGCPFGRHDQTVPPRRRCSKHVRRCPTSGTLDLTSNFRHRQLPVGTQITIVIIRAQYVGKYYSFTVRSRRQPQVRIACLADGGTRPGVGC